MQVVEQGQEVRYVVETVDPHATYPHLTDERYECATPEGAARRYDDLTGTGAHYALFDIEDGVDLSHADPETGVEVTARRG